MHIIGAKKSVSESPYGEAKGIIGGSTIIFAEDMTEAMDIANQCPILLTNAIIEVRQIKSV